MPLTPFHLGPALFFGILLFGYIHFPTFLISSVIVDIEPFLVLLFNLNYSLHGFLHSFLGGSLVAIILSLLMIRIGGKIQKVAKLFKLEQKCSNRNIWFASFSGIYLHILLDSPLYVDIKPFYPLDFNPFYNILTGVEIYSLCALLFLGGFIIYLYKLIKGKL